MYSVKIHYWPQEEEDKNVVDPAAYKKRMSETVKVIFYYASHIYSSDIFLLLEIYS